MTAKQALTWWACPMWKPCGPQEPGDPVVLVLGLVWAVLFWFWVGAAFRVWTRRRQAKETRR